jgi:hypothetical protein
VIGHVSFFKSWTQHLNTFKCFGQGFCPRSLLTTVRQNANGSKAYPKARLVRRSLVRPLASLIPASFPCPSHHIARHPDLVVIKMDLDCGEGFQQLSRNCVEGPNCFVLPGHHRAQLGISSTDREWKRPWSPVSNHVEPELTANDVHRCPPAFRPRLRSIFSSCMAALRGVCRFQFLPPLFSDVLRA